MRIRCFTGVDISDWQNFYNSVLEANDEYHYLNSDFIKDDLNEFFYILGE